MPVEATGAAEVAMAGDNGGAMSWGCGGCTSAGAGVAGAGVAGAGVAGAGVAGAGVGSAGGGADWRSNSTGVHSY